MDKLLSRRKTEEDMHMNNHESITRTPRWVKVSGIIAILLILLVVITMLISGGEHGPGRHMPSSNSMEQGVKQP